MRLPLLFARRYLFSRGARSVINIISGLSAFAVGVPVAAMVILLSVFNGFDSLVRSMYNDFDPDLTVTSAEGRTFDRSLVDSAAIASLEGVRALSFTLEENVLLGYKGRQAVATLRGADAGYPEVSHVREMTAYGQWPEPWQQPDQGLAPAVPGLGLAGSLGTGALPAGPVDIYALGGGTLSSLLPATGYRREQVEATAVFALDAETDSRYMLVPLAAARRLTGRPQAVSQLMLSTGGDDRTAQRVKRTLERMLGDGFRVLTRYEQKASLYRIMRYEKWGIFFIALLVMAVASFSIAGSLTMLVIDKRRDIGILRAMGAPVALVRRIFETEGMLICLCGSVTGAAAGLAVCLVQRWTGAVKLPAATFLAESYPVEVRALDLACVAVAFCATGWLITKFTVLKTIPRKGDSL